MFRKVSKIKEYFERGTASITNNCLSFKKMKTDGHGRQYLPRILKK